MTTDAKYWEHRLQKNWGLHGVGHISYGVPYNRWLYKVRRHIFSRETRNIPVEWNRADVLDVGSGTGFWIEAWKALGVRSVTGSDITHTSVERLRKAYPGSQILQLDISGSLEQQNVTGSYDVISAFDVLFHIIDDADFTAALVNVARLLRPGGFFIFSDNFLRGCGRKASHQINRTMKEISIALASAKLHIVHQVPMFVLMNAPIDTEHEWLLFLWRTMMFPIHLVPLLGHLYGAALYPLELCATHFLKESPTTEMMICHKEECA
jgi:SAM-dependent methyltransferase